MGTTLYIFGDKNVNSDELINWTEPLNHWSHTWLFTVAATAMNCWTSSTASDHNDGHSCAGGSQATSSSSSSTSSSPQSKTTRVSTMSRVLDYLFISSARSITYSNINKYKITHIINATIEVPIIHLNGIKTIRIPVRNSDRNESPQSNWLREPLIRWTTRSTKI